MGKCSARHFVITICTLQLITVVECQVFDFMGFMYGPILANFFHIIFIIHGFFGALQYSTKYILSYTLWNVFWVGWTVFVICFYLDVGVLDKNSDILNLGTGSRSWWEIHGYGCMADFTSVINGSSLEQDPDPSRPPKPTKVEGCLIEYQFVEVIQAAMQCLLSVLAIISGVYMSKLYIEEDDSSFFWNNSKSLNQVELHATYVSDGSKKWKCCKCRKREVKFRGSDQEFTFGPKERMYGRRQPGEVKENSEPANLPSAYCNYNTSRNHLDQYQQQIRSNGYGPRPISPRPMTPRRVKRRSVLARDTMNRNSLNHRRQGSARSNRSSQRRTRSHQNPVTKLLEQQNRFLDSSLISTSFNESTPTNSIIQSGEVINDLNGSNRFKSGLNNPIFQQSSNSSINQSGADEIYRPNSARSSYSNYHASRPISYLHHNEYFTNQAVAQVPISTNRNKMGMKVAEAQNNLFQPPSKANPSNLKSFTEKNFNFLGLNIKTNATNSASTSSNNNNNNINNNNNNLNAKSSRYDGTIRNSKRFRVDLTRTTESIANSFFSQGPPAYREGGLDSETAGSDPP